MKFESDVCTDNLELRPIIAQLNSLIKSDGSALLCQGRTSVIASMSGPIESKSQNAKVDQSHVDVTFHPKAGPGAIRDKFQEHILRNICQTAILTTLHPRTTILIQIQELDNQCGLEACAVNAACLALLVGGVPMKYTVAAIHCVVGINGNVILDPDYVQAYGTQGRFIFVFDSLNKNIAACYTIGAFTMQNFKDAMALSMAASDIIFNFYKKIIARSQRWLPGTEEQNEVAEGDEEEEQEAGQVIALQVGGNGPYRLGYENEDEEVQVQGDEGKMDEVKVEKDGGDESEEDADDDAGEGGGDDEDEEDEEEE